MATPGGGTGRSSPTKCCIQCSEHKSMAEFPRNRNRADGRDNRCKRCTARVVAARVARRPPVLQPQVSHKVCVRCGKEKPAAAFNRNKVRPDGLCSYCKVCNAAAAAERRKTRQPVLQPTVTHKVCSECGEDQPAASFHRSKSYNDGLYGKCKRCCAAGLSRRRASNEAQSAQKAGRSPTKGRRGGSGQPLAQADVSHMLSDVDKYGDATTRALAELVAENARGDNPARTPEELAVALVRAGSSKETVDMYLPGIASSLFGRSNNGGGAQATTSTGGGTLSEQLSDSEADGTDSEDSARTASGERPSRGRGDRRGAAGLPPRHPRPSDASGGRAAVGLSAADIGGGAFGSPQSLPSHAAGSPSAAAGAQQAQHGDGPAASAGRRRTRASIRTTSRLNAAYAIEMMRNAEGAADMQHIMDSMVGEGSSPAGARGDSRRQQEQSEQQQAQQAAEVGGYSLRRRTQQQLNPDISPADPSAGGEDSPHGGGMELQRRASAVKVEWPGPSSTTSGSPASAQTPLYNAPTAGLMAKLQAAREMSRQRMLANLAEQGLPPPPEPARSELLGSAASGGEGQQQQQQQQPGQPGQQMRNPYHAALELLGLTHYPTSGNPAGAAHATPQKRPRDVESDFGLPAAKRRADGGAYPRNQDLRQILDSGGNPWALAAAAAGHMAAGSSSMGGGAAGGLDAVHALGLSAAMADPTAAAAAAAAAYGASGAAGSHSSGGASLPPPLTGSGLSFPPSSGGGRGLIEDYLPASTAALMYAAHVRGQQAGGQSHNLPPQGQAAHLLSPTSQRHPHGLPASPFAGPPGAAAFAAALAASPRPEGLVAPPFGSADFLQSRIASLGTPRASAAGGGAGGNGGASTASPMSPMEWAGRWADMILGSSQAAGQARSRSGSPISPSQLSRPTAQRAGLPVPLHPSGAVLGPHGLVTSPMHQAASVAAAAQHAQQAQHAARQQQQAAEYLVGQHMQQLQQQPQQQAGGSGSHAQQPPQQVSEARQPAGNAAAGNAEAASAAANAGGSTAPARDQGTA